MTAPRRLPPLNALKVFEAAARHLSFRKAADELHVTPGAVSHQLSQLESMLGIKLFERIGQGIRLTPSARACLPRLQHGLEALRDSVDLLYTGARAIINVASPPSFAQRWLLPRLHRFVMGQPDIDVHVSTRLGPFLSERQQRRPSQFVEGWGSNADIVIVFTDVDLEELDAQCLMALSVAPMCAPRFHQANGSFDDPSALDRLHLLHDDRGSLYTDSPFWRLWLEHAGAGAVDPDLGTHFAHSLLSLSAAEEGLGIVASTPVLAIDSLKEGRLVRPFALEVPLHASYQLFSPKSSARRSDVATFRDWLLTEAKHSELERRSLKR